MQKVRWSQISIVFQGSMNALNPVKTIGDQILEPIIRHERQTSRAEAARRVSELLDWVGIPSDRARNYPHEFSGGMRQRAMIAMALACRPRLIIADEPVTALDVMIQAQILSLMNDLRRQLDLALILISHDLSVIAETCDHVAIMYAGKLVEHGDVDSVFNHPAHPYTQALIRAFPNINGAREFIGGVPGYPPNLIRPPTGCRFYERCPIGQEVCIHSEPVLRNLKEEHTVACHFSREA
jgi:peptide/nickel transport system ATP-binding protein